MKIKRYKNYISWQNKKGHFNTECNRASLENDLCLTIPTCDLTKIVENSGGGLSNMKNNLRIRKLTPKECLRLMGFEDADYQALVDMGLSDSAIYHCAGDSIITTCLVGLIGSMTEIDYAKSICDYVERVKEHE